MKFGPLIIIEIIKIVAGRWQILKAKMHKIRFRSAGAPPQTPLWKLTVLPGPLAAFKGGGGERLKMQDLDNAGPGK